MVQGLGNQEMDGINLCPKEYTCICYTSLHMHPHISPHSTQTTHTILLIPSHTYTQTIDTHTTYIMPILTHTYTPQTHTTQIHICRHTAYYTTLVHTCTHTETHTHLKMRMTVALLDHWGIDIRR